MVIVPLGSEHVEEVARLHCASLTGLLSALGLQAARAFYVGCVRTPSAVAFVFLDEGVVQGYVLGSANPVKLKQEVLWRNAAGTLAGLSAGILRRPAVLASLVRSFRGPDEGSYDAQAPELTYLAVAGNRRRGRIGMRLVDAFSQGLRDAGVQAYEVSVDDDNQPAIDFYERLGFRPIGRYREFGILHRRYRFAS